jgi:hypothetical protein
MEIIIIFGTPINQTVAPLGNQILMTFSFGPFSSDSHQRLLRVWFWHEPAEKLSYCPHVHLWGKGSNPFS